MGTRIISRKVVRMLVKTGGVAALIALAVVVVAPITYSEQAHLVLDRNTRALAGWGNQIIGIDVTAVRQNVFSLARDVDRTVTVVNHGEVLASRVIGLANWVSRGSVHTVADALGWFDVPLSTTQARLIQLCQPLDALGDDQPIVIQSDAWQYGIASWYGPGFHGRLAASGELYNMYDRTAAHKTLPLGSLVRVVSQSTGQSVVVRVNDRGPYVGGRIIDLSHRAKELLGMGGGLAAVYLERIDPSATQVSCP